MLFRSRQPTQAGVRAEAIEDELADIMLYLAQLCSKLNVDLDQAVQRKLLKNAAKYPADEVRGSAEKR